MPLIQTAIYFCVACLAATVVFGAVFIDPRFTLLLLPPLIAFYADESYLPEAVAERMRNPKPMTKALLALTGTYIGLRLTGCDVDGALQKLLLKKQGANEL